MRRPSTAVRRLGLDCKDLQVRIGSRALLAELFASAGLSPEHFPACYLALDKRGKISEEEIAALLAGEGVPQDRIGDIIAITAITSLDEAALRVDPSSKALTDLRDFFAIAEPMGIREFVTLDLSIVRGLGYYTGIVFEAFDTERKLRAIFGGGRYDSLLSSLGGDRMPCVGLGFGDVVIAELLADCGKTPRTSPMVDFAVGHMEPAGRDFALALAARVRAGGRSCDTPLNAEKAKAFFKRANRIGAQNAVYIGPEEVATGRFQVKNMVTGEQVAATADQV